MAKGDVIKNNFFTYVDEHTGAKVTRLTEPSHVSHHMYFYNNMITNDGKKLLYCAEINGERQLYLMDLETGDAVQMTDGDKLGDYSGMLTGDDKYLIYRQGGKFYKQNIETGEEKCFYETAEGWAAGGDLGPSSDFKYMSIVETRIDTMAKKGPGKNWNGFAESCLAKPLCRIVYIDMEKGTSKIVHEERCWLGHTQIRPVYGDKILFCHEGPYDLIDARLWCINIDGSDLRCLREQPSDLIITHEIWMPDGEKVAYVYKETTGRKEENVRMIPMDTYKEEVFVNCSPYAHFNVSPDGKWMVGDSQGHDVPIHMLDHSEEKDRSGEVKNDFIYLVDVEARKEIKLCYHGSSWRAIYGNSQDTHPHPFFAKDSKSVIFTSDLEGMPCLYRVELP